jgi:hypothetical protein
MISRGALNGSDINAVALNGGSAQLALSAADTAAAVETMSLTRRLVAQGADAALAGEQMKLTSILSISAVANGSGTATLGLVRRVVLVPRDTASADGALRLTRRTRLYLADTATAAQSMRLAVSYRPIRNLRRVMRFYESRSMRVEPDLRTITLQRRAGPMIAIAKRGAMP